MDVKDMIKPEDELDRMMREKGINRETAWSLIKDRKEREKHQENLKRKENEITKKDDDISKWNIEKDIEYMNNIGLFGEEPDKISLLEEYNVFDRNKKGDVIGVKCIHLAKLLMNGDNKKYIVTKDNQEIFSFNGSYYEPCGDAIIKQRVQYYLNDEVKGLEHYKSEVVGFIKNNEYTEREKLNPKLNLINTKNGVYDIDEDKLTNHTTEYTFLQEIPIAYNKNAKIEKIKKFLEETFNQEDIPVIQEFLGDCLYRSHRYKKALILVGATDTGKSQFLSLLGKFIGEINISHIPLDRLCHDKFAAVELYGKLVNIRSELHIKALRSIDMFLMITGGDVIGAERKYQNSFNFRSFAKLIFSCNEIPDTENKNDAYYNRWIPIECSNQIPKENRIPDFFEVISSDEELSGLFNYAIEGLKRLLKNGSYSHHRSIEEVKEFMQKGKNPIREFIDQYIVRDTNGEATKDFVYHSYVEFCKNMGYPVKESNVFSRKFKPLAPLGMDEGQKGNKKTWQGITCTYVSATFDVIDKQQETLFDGKKDDTIDIL